MLPLPDRTIFLVDDIELVKLSEDLLHQPQLTTTMASVPVDISGLAANGDVSGVIHEYDVIIVGAGFSGISSLYRCRKEGLKAHVFEAGMFGSNPQ